MATNTTTEQPTGGQVARVAGTVARQEFTGTQLEVLGETAGGAMAAQAKALVEARFIMAMRRPRDWDDVRAKMLRACERPGFAGSATQKVWGAAWFLKPVGDGVEGFSIRFAEEAARCMGNLDVQTVTVFDDEQKRIVQLMVIDLENNTAFSTSITVEKTVERKFLKKGEESIRVRMNSESKPVYLVHATDDEVFTKQQNLISKAVRNNVLRLLPGDIQSECRARILEIRNGDIAKDPDGARKKIADAFGALNVLPSHLKQFLGHDLAIATPAEIADLRQLYQAISAGETTFAEALAGRLGEDVPEDGKPTPGKPGLDGVTERLQEQHRAADAPAAGPTPAATTTQAEPASEAKAAIDPKTCKHDDPAVARGVAAGKIVVCPSCGIDVHPEPPAETAAPASREPGSDDDDDTPTAAAGTLPGFEDPNRKAVEQLAGRAAQQATRKGGKPPLET